ncbi:MAG: hypothetical protein CMI60_07900 [Parvibaculum sp.]|nr:hypothetical protein [Parvibaculum sp.]
MPVLFPDNLKHNNANRPILDIGNNQVKGMGIFASVADRNALDSTIQTDGFLALTNDGGAYRAYVFTGSTWNQDDNWTEVGGDALPSGSNFSVLVRDGSNAVAFDTTPRVSSVDVFNSVGGTSPDIVFTRTSSDSGVAQATTDGQSLGSLTFKGHNNANTSTAAGAIKFTQVGAASTNVSSKFELSVGTSSGAGVAVTVNEEKVLSLSQQNTPPTVVVGGLYVDSGNVYFGIT